MNRHCLSLVSFLCLFLLGACSGGDDPLEAANSALRRGDLERAETLLAELEVEGAGELRAQLSAARAHREETAGALDRITSRAPEAPRKEILGELRALLAAESDPVMEKEIKVAMSRLEDVYAHAGQGGTRTWSPPPEEEIEEPRDPLHLLGPAPGESEEPDSVTAEGLAGLWDDDETEPPPPVVVSDDPPVASAEMEPEPEPAAPAPVRPAELETVRDIELFAWERLREGDVATAKEAWLEAASRVESPEERLDFVGRARDLDDRLRLRAELAQAAAQDPAAFEALGVAAVTDEGLLEEGRVVPWKRVPLDRWIVFGRTVNLSARAELGLAQERLVRHDDARAWQRLRRLVREERIEEADVFDAVARHRSESVPEGGYVFDGGDWLPAAEAAELARERLAKKLVKDFEEAGPDERDEAFDELFAEGFETELRAALQARWDAIAKRFEKDGLARRLRLLAEQRQELDRRREVALELIFDEEEYFYPYNPPACPPERAKLYPAVQQRVDRLVDEVRKVWADDARVALRGSLREMLEEAAWLVLREDEWGKASILPDSLPYWIFGLDLELEEVGIAEFAWDEDERDLLARSRQIRDRNRAMWESGEVPENGLAAGTAQRRQVEITNDYRLLLGRNALAWNPLIQAAAWDHSDYMARTGDFGHFEPDPERKGPGERMKRRGYDRGAGENCHGGGGDPMGAHVGWIHSSGHHRNLLADSHTEMASGLVGRYWSQNFGGDDSFLRELPGWSD